MEGNRNYFLKNAVTYGAITGVTLGALLVILSLFFSRVSGSLLDYIILIVGITAGIKALRDRYEDGYISYSRAIKVGLAVSLFAAIVYGFFEYVLYTFKPDLLDHAKNVAEEKLLQQGKSEEEVELVSPVLNFVLSPLGTSISTLIAFPIIGLLVSLFIGIFMKRDRSPFDQPLEQSNNSTQAENN